MPDSIIGKISVGDGATFTPSVTDGVISWTNNKNLPNPEPYDMAAKVLDEGENELRTLVTTAQNAATTATGAAGTATAAATAAGVSETNAGNSATAASGSASAANTSATNAAASETNASNSATAAAGSASAAADSADDAEAAAEFVKKDLPLPIGFEYFSMNPNIPQGSLPLIGGVYSRETYADLWAWVQTQSGYLKTEAEWQTLSTANNGNVPYYSSGDGSTTFRVPSLHCWIKGSDGSAQLVGSYLAAGLPNITGSWTEFFGGISPDANAFTGAIYLVDTAEGGVNGSTIMTVGRHAGIDASRSSSIYGNASTVQPESIVGMWLVKCYGTIADTGTIDEQQYIDDRMQALRTEMAQGDVVSAPVGCVQAFAGSSTPSGWLFCDGSAVSRITYAELYAVIGDTYGSGDGSTTFNLPNLIDKFVQGNATSGTEHSAGLPNITGSESSRGFANDANHCVQNLNGVFYEIGRSSSDVMAVEKAGGTMLSIGFDASRSSAIYGNSTTVQPPSVTMRYIIKY